MTDQPQLLVPTQEDRDAAWPHRPLCYGANKGDIDAWYSGTYDSIAVIQAFARHASSAREQGIREGREEAARVGDNFMRWSGSAPLSNTFDTQGIAKAIRALPPVSPPPQTGD